MKKQAPKEKILHFAIYLKECNPEHKSYIKHVHKVDSLGKILNPFGENSNGGDLALYFLTNENMIYRKRLKKEILLHLIRHIPTRIYKAEFRDLTLGEYAVQQCILGNMDAEEFLPDECWLALLKKGSTQFDEVIEDEAHPFHLSQSKILSRP